MPVSHFPKQPDSEECKLFYQQRPSTIPRVNILMAFSRLLRLLVLLVAEFLLIQLGSRRSLLSLGLARLHTHDGVCLPTLGGTQNLFLRLFPTGRIAFDLISGLGLDDTSRMRMFAKAY